MDLLLAHSWMLSLTSLYAHLCFLYAILFWVGTPV